MEKTRHDELTESFLKFNDEHPEVLTAFCRFTLQLIRAGREHGGAKMVMERVRWDSALGSREPDTFKVNNNFTAFYARAFHQLYSEHDGFFRTRNQVSKDAAAVGLPDLRPSYYEDPFARADANQLALGI